MILDDQSANSRNPGAASTVALYPNYQVHYTLQPSALVRSQGYSDDPSLTAAKDGRSLSQGCHSTDEVRRQATKRSPRGSLPSRFWAGTGDKLGANLR